MSLATVTPSSAARNIPPDVSEFARNHSIEGYLEQAVALATVNFEAKDSVLVELDTDFETGDQRIVIQATVRLPLPQTLERYQRLVAEWVSVTPESIRYLFSFSYDIRPQ